MPTRSICCKDYWLSWISWFTICHYNSRTYYLSSINSRYFKLYSYTSSNFFCFNRRFSITSINPSFFNFCPSIHWFCDNVYFFISISSTWTTIFHIPISGSWIISCFFLVSSPSCFHTIFIYFCCLEWFQRFYSYFNNVIFHDFFCINWAFL